MMSTVFLGTLAILTTYCNSFVFAGWIVILLCELVATLVSKHLFVRESL